MYYLKFPSSFLALWNWIIYQYYTIGVSKTLYPRTTELCLAQAWKEDVRCPISVLVWFWGLMMPKWEGHPDIKRLIKVLATLMAVEIFPFTSVTIGFSPVLQIQGSSCGDVYWHLMWRLWTRLLLWSLNSFLWTSNTQCYYVRTIIIVNLWHLSI